MEKYNSFEGYVEDKYYNEIYGRIRSYIFENKNKLNLHSYSVPDPSRFNLDTIHVMSATFKDAPDDNIKFNLAVYADIEIDGRGKYDWEQDMIERWFRVTFIGVLKEGLHDLKITNVEEYSKERFNAEDCLTRFLVPYIYSKDLDKVAEHFLKRYYPYAIDTPMPIPIEEIVDRMGLHMISTSISKDDAIFGKTYFSNAVAQIYDDESQKYISMDVKAGTILVDPKVCFMRNMGSMNNTIIHECVHWDKHRKFFELQKLLNNEITAISCHTVEGNQKEEKSSALDWMEWQANALAPRILMPARATRTKINNLLMEYHFTFPELSESEMMERIIEDLATFFNVSRFAAKLRAIDLGFDQAEGTFVFVDNRYLPGYSFKQGSLKCNQTYTIDLRNAVYASCFNQDFKLLIQGGEYIYVEAKFCINDAKYIGQDEYGTFLTDYARQNVDECCLIFDQKNQISNHFDDSYYRQCFLCRNVSADNYTETNYVEIEDNQDVKERAVELAKIKAQANKFNEIFKNLPNSFCGTLDAHISRKGLTNLKLQDESLISERTIRELRRNEEQNSDIITIISLCIGLHLHPLFSEDLINKSGVRFKPTEEHFFFRFLLTNHYMDSIDLCNQKLEEMNYHKLGKMQNI